MRSCMSASTYGGYMKLFRLVLLLSICMGSLSRAEIPSISEGVYRGTSSTGKHLTLLLRKAPDSADHFNAILAEYLYPPEKLRFILNKEYLKDVAHAVPQMYLYRADRYPGEWNYRLTPLHLDGSGDLIPNPDMKEQTLEIFLGAYGLAPRIRFDGKELGAIEFNEKPHSTWENYVSGNFIIGFHGTYTSVLSYNARNLIPANSLELAESKVETGRVPTAKFIGTKFYLSPFLRRNYSGQFDMIESKQVPGIYLLRNARRGAKGAKKLQTRVAAFVDIVNWKTNPPEGQKRKCTDEMVLFNPENPKDVTIYYERNGDCS
jgi:hypothetical protein